MSETDYLLFGNKVDRLNKLLKSFKKTSTDLSQDINILIQWIKSQPHLPEVPGDNFLQNIILLNKFSIENSKKHLDMYYTSRSLLPELYDEKNLRLPHMVMASKVITYVPLPKFTDEGYRVSVMKAMHNNADEYFPYDVAAYLIKFMELRLMSDVMTGEVFVLDVSNFTFGHVTKFTPIVVKKIFYTAEKVYKNIVKQIHFVNVLPVVDGLISLVKQIASKKISERIYSHQSLESLYQFLPQEMLPKEYGGCEISFIELKDKWLDLLDKYERRLDELANLKTDESKRPTPLVNDELLGFHGNFKKLNVD